MKIAERPTCQASNRREAVGSCQEYLETPIMSSGRWSRLPLLPPRLSPPLDALLMSCYCSPLTPVSLFITHCTALLRFIHFIFFCVVASLISFFIFILTQWLAAMLPSSPPSASLCPAVLPETKVFHYILTSNSQDIDQEAVFCDAMPWMWG